MPEKRTMTPNLTDEEMGTLEELSSRYDLSKTAIIRRALRMYHAIDERLQCGEKLFVEDELQKKKSELIVL